MKHALGPGSREVECDPISPLDPVPATGSVDNRVQKLLESQAALEMSERNVDRDRVRQSREK